MKDNISTFEEYFQNQLVNNEKVRLTFLAAIGFILLFVIMILYSFDWPGQSKISNATPIYITIGIIILLIGRELVLKQFILPKLIGNKKRLELLFYGNIIIEISVPTLIITVFFIYYKNVVPFLSPAITIYFLVIMTTIFYLDIKKSIFAGFVAALQYFLVIYYFLPSLDPVEQFIPLYKINFYAARSASILISGILAGFIGLQIKKGVIKSYHNYMDVREITEMFGQQISREIVTELISNKNSLSTEKKYVAVMFLDIRGFTPFAEQKSPEEIIKYQNEIFGFMIESIVNNQGIINQFLGDGYMATFGAPISHDNDCQNAINASIEILKKLKKKNQSGEIPFTEIGIGIHSGYIVAGNVGTEKRRQYSITGNTVILASRIEQLNKKYSTNMLISKEVNDQIKNQTDFVFVDKTLVKGKEDPIEIYRLKEGTIV